MQHLGVAPFPVALLPRQVVAGRLQPRHLLLRLVPLAPQARDLSPASISVLDVTQEVLVGLSGDWQEHMIPWPAEEWRRRCCTACA